MSHRQRGRNTCMVVVRLFVFCVVNHIYLDWRPAEVRLDGVDSILFDPQLVNLRAVLRM